jgi:GT2 family glycosyltransferase
MNRELSLAVVIPTWRRTKQLKLLLNALHFQTRRPDEVIVACRQDDHESINLIEEWIHHAPLGAKGKLVKVHEPGHLPPLIAALKMCASDVFVQIDDDAIPKGDWLEHLFKDFTDPKIGGVGGMVIDHNKETTCGTFEHIRVKKPGKLSWYGRSGKHGRRINGARLLFEADCFFGNNMAYRRKALINSIDMALNGGSAISYETDVALNTLRLGFQTGYDPKVIVDHFPAPRKINVQRGWNDQECFWYAHNLTYICLKHLPWYGKCAFLFYFFVCGQWGCPALLTYLLALIRQRPVRFKQQLIPSLKGRWAGIKTYLRHKPFNQRQIA